MKAVSFSQHGSIDVLKYGDVPDPEVGPGEVLLRIEAAACNFNDIWARLGLPRITLPLPHVSGTDAAGVVVEVGEGVTGVSVGDEVITYPVRSCRRCNACLAGEEVFCKGLMLWGFQTGPYDGAYAEYAKVQAEQVLPKPAHLTWEEAAATTTSLLSVWRMLVTRAQVQPGDQVLIWGASGGTGSFAIQLAKEIGAIPIAVTSSEKKAEWCSKMGATHVLRSDCQDIEAEVSRITDRRGVDVVFDHVGEPVWNTSVECLRWGGKIVICGATEGFQATIDLRYLWNKQLSFLGSHIGTRKEWVQAMKLIEARRIHPPVTEIFDLPGAIEAQRRMENRELMGKLAIRIGS